MANMQVMTHPPAHTLHSMGHYSVPVKLSVNQMFEILLLKPCMYCIFVFMSKLHLLVRCFNYLHFSVSSQTRKRSIKKL